MAVTHRVRRYPRSYIISRRKWRLQTEWSMANARLGGFVAVEHPWCATIENYIRSAPYAAPSREWGKFRAWMKQRVERVNDGGTSRSCR